MICAEATLEALVPLAVLANAPLFFIFGGSLEGQVKEKKKEQGRQSHQLDLHLKVLFYAASLFLSEASSMRIMDWSDLM